jgi:hypothetical protein
MLVIGSQGDIGDRPSDDGVVGRLDRRIALLA